MAKIKFNNRRLALLCEYCDTIVATGENIPDRYVYNTSNDEHVFCSEECKAEYLKEIEVKCLVTDYHETV